MFVEYFEEFDEVPCYAVDVELWVEYFGVPDACEAFPASCGSDDCPYPVLVVVVCPVPYVFEEGVFNVCVVSCFFVGCGCLAGFSFLQCLFEFLYLHFFV